VTSHSEMAGHSYISALKRAIESPVEVTVDTDRDDRQCFYGDGPWTNPLAASNEMVKAVVEWEKRPWAPHGVLVTAYATYSIPPSERVIWRQK